MKKLDIKQTKLIGLTYELEIKTREYKKLCDELDALKALNIDPNHPSLLDLLKRFSANNQEIKAIQEQLKTLV